MRYPSPHHAPGEVCGQFFLTGLPMVSTAPPARREQEMRAPELVREAAASQPL